jgi:hypothetical protein
MNKLYKYIAPLNVLGVVALLLAFYEVIFQDIDGWWIGGSSLLILFVTIPSLALNVVISRTNITKKSKSMLQFGILFGYLLVALYYTIF